MASSGTVGKFNTGGNDYLIASTAFATCYTSTNTAAKVATIQDDASFTLMAGMTIYVEFIYGNDSTSPTLNVNSTGAIAIYDADNIPLGTGYSDAGIISAGAIIPFVYNGTYWKICRTSKTKMVVFEATVSDDTVTSIEGQSIATLLNLYNDDVTVFVKANNILYQLTKSDTYTLLSTRYVLCFSSVVPQTSLGTSAQVSYFKIDTTSTGTTSFSASIVTETIVTDVTYDGNSVVAFGTASIPAELFICSTSTTYAEVTSAIAAGKIPVLYDSSSGLVAFLSGGDDSDVVPYYSFSGQVGTYGLVAFVTYRLLNTDVWQAADSYYVSTASIDDTSTNNQIPTALAVYNALSSAGGSSLYYDQITLNTSSWSSNTYTATVSGMTSTAIVWVNPTDDSKTYWTRANVRATSQSLDTLVFTCTDQELASYTSLNVNVVWTEPASQS